MNGRWVNNCWLNDNDIMEELTAQRFDLRRQLSYLELKIEALRHEQYQEYREFIEKVKKS